MVSLFTGLAPEGMSYNEYVFDNIAADKVLLNDPFERVGVARPVPRALRVHYSDRAAFTNPQTVRLASKNPPALR